MIFEKGDEIKNVFSKDKFIVLYVDDVYTCLYVLNKDGGIETIDKYDEELKYVATGVEYECKIEITTIASSAHDKKESVDILKSEIAKISYELNRIVNELHALNRKK